MSEVFTKDTIESLAKEFGFEDKIEAFTKCLLDGEKIHGEEPSNFNEIMKEYRENHYSKLLRTLSRFINQWDKMPIEAKKQLGGYAYFCGYNEKNNNRYLNNMNNKNTYMNPEKAGVYKCFKNNSIQDKSQENSTISPIESITMIENDISKIFQALEIANMGTRGKPGKSQTHNSAISLDSLYAFGTYLKWFWEKEKGIRFGNSFDKDDGKGTKLLPMNDASKFFFKCAKCLDHRYTVSNCRSIMRRIQKGQPTGFVKKLKKSA